MQFGEPPRLSRVVRTSRSSQGFPRHVALHPASGRVTAHQGTQPDEQVVGTTRECAGSDGLGAPREPCRGIAGGELTKLDPQREREGARVGGRRGCEIAPGGHRRRVGQDERAMRPSTPCTNEPESSGRELLGQFHRLVDRDRSRDLVVVEDLPHSDAEHGTVHGGHARERPVLREGGDLLIDRVAVVDHAVDDLTGVEPGCLARGFAHGALCFGGEDGGYIGTPHIGLEEDVEGALARLGASAHASVHAAEVVTGAGVDLDLGAGLQEQRDLDLVAGLDRRRLRAAEERSPCRPGSV